MPNIAVIGVGNLGGRHAQSLAALDFPCNIQIIDTSETSLNRAGEWFAGMNPSPYLKLEKLTGIEDAADKIDIAIVATNANVRAAVTEKLLSAKNVRYLILEKVLFQNPEDYPKINALIKAHGCKTWVNCPRRTVTFYKQLKSLYAEEKIFDFSVTGANWELGCNSIHFLDMLAFISGSSAGFSFDTSGLDKKLIDNKRPGFKEFTGVLRGSSRNCANFAFSATQAGSQPHLITIRSENTACMIKEFEAKAYLYQSKNKWTEEVHALDGKYQSQLTSIIVADILKTGGCELTPYEESMQLHEAYIEALIDFLNNTQEEKTQICPIT